MIKDPVAMADAMSSFVNVMNSDVNTFIERMANDHRTLQQSFANLCFAFIREQARKHAANQFDLRNEYTVTKCAEICSNVELMDGPYI